MTMWINQIWRKLKNQIPETHSVKFEQIKKIQNLKLIVTILKLQVKS